MNHKQLLLTYVILLFGAFVSVAQNPIATLEHGGASQIFSGQGSLVEAYNASANGDRIYLSTGFFTPPPAIAKGIKIIGAGHFPDSVNIAKRTVIIPGYDGYGTRLHINAGADSLHLEGLYIDGDIIYDASSSISYVKVIRCRLVSAFFSSNSASAGKSNCSYKECYIIGGIDFSHFGNNLLVKQCILNSAIGNINGDALIDGNIFLRENYPFQNVLSSVIQNNIIVGNTAVIFSSCIGSQIRNNLFVSGSIEFGLTNISNNYTNIPQTYIFVNQTGNEINYSHNYHLKNPEKYLGTDGTQVGIYGGLPAFKEKGAPSNPQIIKKTIAEQTDANGNLKVDVTVKAQEY